MIKIDKPSFFLVCLLTQNCLTTKLIDLPDSEEYEDSISKSLIKDIESSTPDYPLRKSSTERAHPGSKEIERSSPIAQKIGGPKEKESRNDNLLLSPSYTKQTRRVSEIEPQITLNRERKRSSLKEEKKRYRHHHRSSVKSSRQPSSQGSKEIASHNFHHPTYLSRESQFLREKTSHNDDSRTLRRSNDKYDNEKDENIKKKITSLVEQTLHDTEKKIESIQGIKNANRDLAPYKIGFILSMVKKSRDMLNELFNTAVKHRDSWRALEQLKIFELIAHTNVDTTNLVRQLVEIHIQHINSTMAHGNSAPPRPEGNRKRLVML